MKKRTRTFIAIALTCLTSQFSIAALLVNESFDYTTSDLVDANGGIGWTGTWKGEYYGTTDCTTPLTNGTFDGFASSPFPQKGKYVYREVLATTYFSREFEKSNFYNK